MHFLDDVDDRFADEVLVAQQGRAAQRVHPVLVPQSVKDVCVEGTLEESVFDLVVLMSI